MCAAATRGNVLGMATEGTHPSAFLDRCPSSPMAFAKPLPRLGICSSTLLILLASPVCAQGEPQDTSIAEMKRQIEALQHRVEELEDERRASKPRAQATKKRISSLPKAKPAESSAQSITDDPPQAVVTTPAGIAITEAAASQAVPQIPGLLPPEAMGTQFEDALRSDLPGLSFRIPGASTEVRFYGFAKGSAYTDLNGRNQSDAPAPQGIPLTGSAADRQGGDFGMSARFSRFGMDTRTLTNWGTLETRIEGDFGGGAAVSNNALFRLRQAWGELGTDRFRVLVGQANSLWNEGMFETLNDSTNLNQSFVRQMQVRATARLGQNLVGQVSLEVPDTQYTSVDGTFTQTNSPNGGLSPAFSSLPDLLGRLAYRNDGLEVDVRGVVRDLSLRTDGTNSAPPTVSKDAFGGGIATSVRLPMRWISEGFGPDQLIGMAYYGQGIGRYFGGNTAGQDALSNIGLPGTAVSLDAIPTYGFTMAYRRFWTTQVRSNAAYSYARQDYPSYASEFTSGSAAATGLNRTMQQAVVNLIWSPFAEAHDGRVDTGWLDTGIEYTFTQRDLFGGSDASGSDTSGAGIANRILAAAIVRF